MEVFEDASLGWKAIINEFQDVKSQGFKVPHHGSDTAYHNDVWNKMLLNESWAATTPFVKGNIRLPAILDCRRILGHTQNAYLTAPPQPNKFKDENRTVEKTVNEATLSVNFIPGKFGHVRFRKNINASADSPWNIELFGSAMTMQDYLDKAQSV